MKPIVAIVGRPNVGKSTFFNRVTRRKDALVDDFPGVTRDRNYGNATWDGIDFTVVDTGGFSEAKADPFAEKVRFQLREAIDHADMIVHMLDGKGGLSPFDTDLLDLLRTVRKPVFSIVNKIDGIEKEPLLYEFYGLGIDTLYPVSAAHGYGIPDFLDDLILQFPKFDSDSAQDMTKVAVVGRPNVGKSSLINRILGKQRLLVSEEPGTTRDAIDTVCKVHGVPYLLIDTAGIRRKGRVTKKIEKFSVIRALRSLARCDVALVIMDAVEGVTDQDITIAGYAVERGCGCVLLLNKWDLVSSDHKTAKQMIDSVRHAAKFLSFAPILTISARTGIRVPRIFERIDTVFEQYTLRTGTGQLNKILEQAVARTPPPLFRGRRIKIYYATQVTVKPPTFVCFTNYPEAIHFSYRRFLVNQIRKEAGLDHTPIRLYFRKRTGRLSAG